MAWCAAHLCLADTPGLADVSQVDSDPLTEEVRLLSPLLTPQDRDIVRGMVRRLAEGLKTDDLTAASIPLRRISDTDIVNTIASIPEEWGINTLEREALRAFLVRRRLALLEIYA